MLRILAGEKKGFLLRVTRSKAVRPTAANARQVLFDILGGRVAGTRWLDLYAGSGAVGLEALSRGAAHCVFVESSRRCVEVIRHNIAHLGYQPRCRVIEERVEKALRRILSEPATQHLQLETRNSKLETQNSKLESDRGTAGGPPFDFVFLDPPYSGDEATRCLKALGQPDTCPRLLSPSGLLIAQISSHIDVGLSYGVLSLQRRKRLGDTNLCFFQMALLT